MTIGGDAQVDCPGVPNLSQKEDDYTDLFLSCLSSQIAASEYVNNDGAPESYRRWQTPLSRLPPIHCPE